MFVTVLVAAAHHHFQLLVAHDGVASLGVELVHAVPHLGHQRIGLVDRVVAGQAEIAVDPVGNGGGAAAAVHGHGGGTVQQPGGVEDGERQTGRAVSKYHVADLIYYKVLPTT